MLTLAFWLNFVIVHALGTLLLNSRCILESKWTPSGLQVTSKCFKKDAKRLQVRFEWPEVLAKPCSLYSLTRFCPSGTLRWLSAAQIACKWPPRGLSTCASSRLRDACKTVLSLTFWLDFDLLGAFGTPLESKWTPSAPQVVSRWVPSGLQVGFKWFPSALQVEFRTNYM